MQAAQTYTFKLFFNAENIRRLSLAPTTLEKFQEQLQTLYPEFYHRELTLAYTDEDGDCISVTAEPEWQEMLHLFAKHKLVKVNIIAKNPEKFFRVGPAPEVAALLVDEKPVEDAVAAEPLVSYVTQALQSLFPDGKILPYNVPSFLDGVVEVTTTGEQAVDLKTDIYGFFDALNKEACRLMDTPQVKGALDKAKELLNAQRLINPNDPNASYNLACAEALTGNAEKAFNWLEQAATYGYDNIDWMLQDPDLAFLRGRQEWNNFVAKMKAMTSPSVETPSQSEASAVPASEPVLAQPEPEAVAESEAVAEPEAVAESAVMDPKWAPQLRVLHDMGFLSDSLLIPALERHGSVEGALAEFLA